MSTISDAIHYLRSPAMEAPRAALFALGGVVIGLKIANQVSSRPWVIVAAATAGVAAGIALSYYIQTTAPQPPAPSPPPSPRRAAFPAPAGAAEPLAAVPALPQCAPTADAHQRLTAFAAAIRTTAFRLTQMTPEQLRTERYDGTAFPIHRPSVGEPNSYLTPAEVDLFASEAYCPRVRTTVLGNADIVIDAYERPDVREIDSFTLVRFGKIATSLRIFRHQADLCYSLLCDSRLKRLQDLVNSHPEFAASLGIGGAYHWVYQAIFEGRIALS